jgi:DNA-binding response OmpR family regulator
MDRNMPEMSGIEATVAIRKAGYRGAIIGLSGDADDGEFLNAGASLVLEKPVPIGELRAAIARVVLGSHKADNTSEQASPSYD